MATAPAALATDCRFRAMTPDDLPRVMQLESAAYPFPWSEQIFRDCVRVGYYCVVVDTSRGVAGYGVMSMGAGEAHVLNICIAEELRGQGVGRRLLESLLDRARHVGMEVAFLEVRPTNTVAISLYSSMGFDQIGVRKGYYQAAGGREDACVYRLHLSRDRPPG